MNEPEPNQSPRAEPSSGHNEIVDESAAQAHPSEDQLALFVAGRLEPTESLAVHTHVASCNQCVTRIDELTASIVSFVADLEQDSVPPNASSSTQSPVNDPNETVDQSIETTSVVRDIDHSEPGTFGDYELLSEIARGGMGVVYKARQKSLNRIVALKMIKSGEFSKQEQVDRFYKEAEAAANLDHPGIVQVFEVGQVDGQHYFAMAFVDGESLAVRLRHGPLPPKEAARYAKSIAEAVAFAHSKGVIHRDLKPGNVLITKEDTLRITDFGLAKRIEEDSELTSTGQVLGTPSYMPPEQAEGKLSEIGPAADIYSIGATLYCMLVGRPPFQAANLIETLQQVISAEPPSLRTLNQIIAVDLDTLCLKCLEKKPSNRYQSADELVHDLGRFLGGEPIKARPVGYMEQGLRWCKRKPMATVALVAITTLAVVGPWAAITQSLANTRTAKARVDALLNASPATIPLILGELDRDATVVRSRLNQLKSDDLTPEERLRLRLALLPSDPSQLSYLKDRLIDCTYEELAVVLGRLKQNDGSSITPDLWTAFHDQAASSNDRFRAGTALAALDSKSDQWREQDYQFLATSMLQENTVYQPAIRQSLQSVADKLVNPVKQAFNDETANDTVRESAANAIVSLAREDSKLLTELSMVATPKQYSILFPSVDQYAKTNDSIVKTFVDVTKLHPKDAYNEARRVALGKRRAGAAISLLRLNEPEQILEVLRVKEDPESLTQFVHGCKARGVTVEQLLGLLNRATSVSERYGLLLALGEFLVTEIAEEIRSDWVELVKSLYANDPSSGIHGVSGWLLRQWGLTEEAKAIEARGIPYSKDREWFTLKINLAGPFEFEKYSYFTFVVFPGGEYEIGSPEHEQDRDSSDETHRGVKMSRNLAVLDREVTRGEVAAVTGFRGFNSDTQWCKDPLGASAAMNWYLAVKFCRGLTSRRGLAEHDQVYADPSQLDRDKYPVDPIAQLSWDREGAFNWPVDSRNSGFRLPTSAEWEIACRSGSVTTFGFGSDHGMLDQYAWYEGPSGNQGHRPRKLRPNLRGLFDMHGNMYEWCHDWSGGNTVADLIDPMGPLEGSLRVLRGGGWFNVATFCRSASRNYGQPTSSNNILGFRVVLSLGVSSTDPE